MPKMGFEHLSLHRQGGWRGQYDRILRWFNRINSKPAPHPDFLFAFFQNCYILRDWLENDEVATRNVLDTFVSNSNDIQMCRDLCNGSKHGKIKWASIDFDPVVGQEYDDFDGRKYFLFIGNKKIGTEKLDPIELASRCVKEWQLFLRDNQLLE